MTDNTTGVIKTRYSNGYIPIPLLELYSMADKDLELDKSQLDDESTRTSKIHGKYIQFYLDELNCLRRMERQMKIIIKEKTQYYLGKSEPDVYKEKPFDLESQAYKGRSKSIFGS